MSERIGVGHLRAKFRRVGEIMGWNITEGWRVTDDGAQRAVVGYVFLERGNLGGWRICQYANEGAAERDITPGILSARELQVWLSGVEMGKTGLRN